MAIPDSPRVVYESNLLELVTCQIRFPTILMIDKSPENFQEAVRGDFPYFETRSAIKLPPGLPPGISQVVQHDLVAPGNRSHVFISDDRTWELTLNKQELSLSCRRYARWEDFRVRLSSVLANLVSIYRPSFFLHTCVRYKNSVRRVPLGLDGVTWSRLLQPWLCGMLSKPEVADSVEATESRTFIRLPDGLGRLEAKYSLGTHQPSREQAFIIESHAFNEDRKGVDDVIPRLDALHRQAGLFFRWCITDELHRAMRPVVV